MCKFYLKGYCSSSQMSAYYFPIEKGKSPLNMQFEIRMLRLGFPLYVSATDYFFNGDCTCKSSIYSMPAIRNHRIVLVSYIPDIIFDYFVPLPWG